MNSDQLLLAFVWDSDVREPT